MYSMYLVLGSFRISSWKPQILSHFVFRVRIVVGDDITAGFTCLYHLPGGLIETLIVQ